MTIASCRVTLYLPGSHSLKEKRSVTQSLLRRLRERHNVSAVEAEGLDLWQKAVLGLALAAPDRREAQARLARLLKDVEELSGVKQVECEPEYQER